MVIAIAAITVVMAAPLVVGLGKYVFPVMIVLGPLMVAQYLFWRRRKGPERKTWQYLQAEPLHRTTSETV